MPEEKEFKVYHLHEGIVEAEESDKDVPAMPEIPDGLEERIKPRIREAAEIDIMRGLIPNSMKVRKDSRFLFGGFSTKEHVKDLKKIILETYRNSKYVKPIAVVQTVGAVIGYDLCLTALRLSEKIHYACWEISLAWHNRKYHTGKILKKLEKKEK